MAQAIEAVEDALGQHQVSYILDLRGLEEGPLAANVKKDLSLRGVVDYFLACELMQLVSGKRGQESRTTPKLTHKHGHDILKLVLQPFYLDILCPNGCVLVANLGLGQRAGELVHAS